MRRIGRLRLFCSLYSRPSHVWRDGCLPPDAGRWQALLQELAATPGMLEAPEVKQQLRDNGEQGIAAGVFGVPSAVVDNRCFWGLDATDMLLAYLRGDPFFQSAQLAQAQNLPQGVHRK